MNSLFAPGILSGKKILVTGASSGIGKATALALAQCGADLLLTGRCDIRLAATASLVSEYVNCKVVTLELTNFEFIAEWVVDMAKLHGPFDGLFHAAGVALIKPMRLVKQKDVNQVFSPSLFAAAALSTGLLKKGGMRDGGSIVFMSSVAGRAGRQGMGLYSASKAGLDGLSRSLAMELAPRGIRVNSIAAGAIRTEMHAQMELSSSNQAMVEYEMQHPLGFGTPVDVSNMVVYLMSDAGRWITGTVVTVDGGYTAK